MITGDVLKKIERIKNIKIPEEEITKALGDVYHYDLKAEITFRKLRQLEIYFDVKLIDINALTPIYAMKDGLIPAKLIELLKKVGLNPSNKQIAAMGGRNIKQQTIIDYMNKPLPKNITDKYMTHFHRYSVPVKHIPTTEAEEHPLIRKVEEKFQSALNGDYKAFKDIVNMFDTMYGFKVEGK